MKAEEEADESVETEVLEADETMGKADERVMPVAEFECQPIEARAPKTLWDPLLPAPEVVAQHNITHRPYRRWCKVCVEAWGREDPHRRGGEGIKEGLPEVVMDYDYFCDPEDEENQVTCLAMKDRTTGMLWGNTCERKGPTDRWILEKQLKNLEVLGRANIALKTDGEPSITSLQSKMISMREGQTVPRNPPAYNPESNGPIEKGVQDLNGQTRCVKVALEARLKKKVKASHPVMQWGVQHAGFIVSRFAVGHDGKTPWERLAGREWKRPLVEFGEQVLGKLARERMERRHRGKNASAKRKLTTRWALGTWVGVVERTGEHIIVARSSGKAVRVRSIKRTPEPARWNDQAVLDIKATPRHPDPNNKERQELDAPVDGDPEGKRDAQDRAEGRKRIPKEEPIISMDVDTTGPPDSAVREMRITKRVLEKFGYTQGCVGCTAVQQGSDKRLHTEACRQRIYEDMSRDQAELPALERAIMRNQGKAARRMMMEQQDADPGPAEPLNDSTTPGGNGASSSNDTTQAEPLEAGPSTNSTGVMPNFGEAQSGQNEEDPDEDSDRDVDYPEVDGMLLAGDEDRMNVIEFDEEEETTNDNEEPMTTHTTSHDEEPPETTTTRGYNDSTTGEGAEKRQRIAQICEILGVSEANKLVADIEAKMPRPARNHRQRRTAKLLESKVSVSEIFSPPRVAAAATRHGLIPGWSLDLTIVDEETGLPWDLSCPKAQAKVRRMLHNDEPVMVMACPPCGAFSSWMHVNYSKMSEEEAQEKMWNGMRHLAFAIEVCRIQARAGRYFAFEHPASATSWTTGMMQALLGTAGAQRVTFDFCTLGMMTKDNDGQPGHAMKKTAVLTNSGHLASILRKAQCDGSHRHIPLEGGKAKGCEVYTEFFCDAICMATKLEIADERWLKEVQEKIGEVDMLGSLQEVQEKFRKMVEPEEEVDELQKYRDMYEWDEFVDDISGAALDKELATKARKLEMDFFHKLGVYTKVKKEPWMKVITTKWLDTNKGDVASPEYRARLVAREIKKDKRDDLFAATPPLESLRFILSACASHQSSPDIQKRHIIMVNDVKRAYFYAKAQRPIYVAIPAEDLEEGDEGYVAKLNLSLYGTRDAAQNWADTYTALLKGLGFEVGMASPCNFYHAGRGISLSVHGDDFTSTGPEASLRWLDAQLKAAYEIKTKYLGPNKQRGHEQEVRVLNRVIRWTKDGITYEPDQRHAELIIADLGLESAKSVTTPGTKEDVAKAEEENSQEWLKPLTPTEVTMFRGICARLNYLALDRPDLQYAAKSASRKMSSPRAGDWLLLKRIGRYLQGVPRMAQMFEWQEWPTEVSGLVDSDWAGCKTSGKSTSGGVLMLGKHTVKSWSSTQATIALSSGEAELYALVKGASQGLGLASLAGDLGFDMAVKVWSDSSAAIGITSRKGLGKVRHVKVQTLWVQDKLRSGDFGLEKIDGTLNMSDILTKHVDANTLKRHLASLGFMAMYGRADTAPTLAQLQRIQHHYNDYMDQGIYIDSDHRSGPSNLRDNSTTTTLTDGLVWLGAIPAEELQQLLDTNLERRASGDHSEGDDAWAEDGRHCVRVHRAPRRELFTPLRVSGAPPARSLFPVRVTVGRFEGSGRAFRITDSWHQRSDAHRDLGERWVGATQFLRRVGDEF